MGLEPLWLVFFREQGFVVANGRNPYWCHSLRSLDGFCHAMSAQGHLASKYL